MSTYIVVKWLHIMSSVLLVRTGIGTAFYLYFAKVSGAWAVPLFKANRDFGVIRKEAALLQKTELEHLEVLRAQWTKALVCIWTLADFSENPMDPLQTIIDEITPRNSRRLTEAPRMADLTGFGQFLQNLRNQGMQPVVMGDFPVGDGPRPATSRRGRPYLVK